MEELGLTIILILATIYVIKYIRRTLLKGENETMCHNCPAVKDISQPERKL